MFYKKNKFVDIMNSANPYNSWQSIHQTIRKDLKTLNIKKDLRHEYRNLSDFYLDSEKKTRLESMDTFQRWIYKTGWLLKSMILHLTPLRRLLVIGGIILLLASRSITYENVTVTTNQGLLGGIMILFVLFLELRDKHIAKHELEAGRKVQQALMPPQSPVFPGWTIWLFTRPANEVGGDLVDFLRIDENKAVMTIADVAGKGLKAALLASKLQSTVRALASETESLSDLGKKLNRIFNRDSLPNLFASMIIVKIDSGSGVLKYVNAGHFPPLIVKNMEIKEFSKGDAALGLMAATDFNEQTVTLEKDEVFIAYSDGIFEARNEAGEFFGIQNFHTLLRSCAGKTPLQTGQYIISVLEQFIGNNPAADDMSLIIIKKEQ